MTMFEVHITLRVQSRHKMTEFDHSSLYILMSVNISSNKINRNISHSRFIALYAHLKF